MKPMTNQQLSNFWALTRSYFDLHSAAGQESTGHDADRESTQVSNGGRKYQQTAKGG